MGLLLLANLDPINDFWDKLPKHIYQSISNFKVNVDGFIIVFKFDTNDVTNDQIRTRVKGAHTRLAESVRRSGGTFAAGRSRITATDNKIATDIVKELNICECDIRDPKSDNCKCSANHRIKCTQQVTMLGVEYAAGKAVKYSRNIERVNAAGDKACKINTIVRGGPLALNLMRSHVITAATDGCRINGMNEKTLSRVRTMVRTAISIIAKGTSATVDMFLQKQKDIDPAFAGNTFPLMECATRVNVASNRRDHQVIAKHTRAWCAALANFSKCDYDNDDQWKHIRGPASACLATLGCIGWKTAIVEEWKT